MPPLPPSLCRPHLLCTCQEGLHPGTVSVTAARPLAPGHTTRSSPLPSCRPLGGRGSRGLGPRPYDLATPTSQGRRPRPQTRNEQSTALRPGPDQPPTHPNVFESGGPQLPPPGTSVVTLETEWVHVASAGLAPYGHVVTHVSTCGHTRADTCSPSATGRAPPAPSPGRGTLQNKESL